jgi:uncharacterized protein YciI
MRLFVLLLCVGIALNLSAQEKPYMFVFLNINPEAEKLSQEESGKLMEGHMGNIRKLAAEGRLLAAGPFEGGGGIFVLATNSEQEAQTWMSTDPGIAAKRWKLEYFVYHPRIGSVCPVSEPYEMVMYSFVRFNSLVSKFNAGTYPQILKAHADYMKQLTATGNVVTEAILGDDDGTILVMKGDVQREIFESDPGIQDGLLDMEIKKLYIAKGSFCEK